MSNAIKKTEITEQGETKSQASAAAPVEQEGKVLEFSILDKIKDIDLSQLGESSEGTGSLTDINTSSQGVGDTTHTQILNIAKANTEVDVLEAQVKLIALFVSEARILEADLNKYILAVNKVSPESKKYLLHMKKIIKNFSNIESILSKAKSVK